MGTSARARLATKPHVHSNATSKPPARRSRSVRESPEKLDEKAFIPFHPQANSDENIAQNC